MGEFSIPASWQWADEMFNQKRMPVARLYLDCMVLSSVGRLMCIDELRRRIKGCGSDGCSSTMQQRSYMYLLGDCLWDLVRMKKSELVRHHFWDPSSESCNPNDSPVFYADE